MTFDLQRILESKLTFRQSLARLPVAEKLAMLDALRDQALALRAAGRQHKELVPIVKKLSRKHERTKSRNYRTPFVKKN